MNKNTFIEILKKQLEDNKVLDIDDILFEYIEHFNYKLEDGYSEEEIGIKLGNPVFLASQYIESDISPKTNRFFLTITGLVFSDFFLLSFYITFVAWIIVLFVFSITSLSIGVLLFTNLNIYGLIPYLPYWNGAILGISFVSIFIFSIIGTYYNYLYLKQLTKSYIRFHKNSMAISKGNPSLPSLPIHPKLSKVTSRRLRSIVLFTLNAFAISLILGYLVSSFTAKSLEFWHVYDWFI